MTFELLLSISCVVCITTLFTIGCARELPMILMGTVTCWSANSKLLFLQSIKALYWTKKSALKIPATDSCLTTVNN